VQRSHILFTSKIHLNQLDNAGISQHWL